MLQHPYDVMVLSVEFAVMTLQIFFTSGSHILHLSKNSLVEIKVQLEAKTSYFAARVDFTSKIAPATLFGS